MSSAYGMAPWRPIAWLNKPFAYTLCAPLLTVMGAATTIAAPVLLTPADFIEFALLFSLFQYISDFDLGLSRLMDRRFPAQDPASRLAEYGLFSVARFWVAAAISIVVLAAGAINPLVAVAGLGGVAFMISNGPVGYYRASSNLYSFSVSALLMQFGMSLPRLAGLLAGGVSGCVIVTSGWYVITAAINTLPFVRLLQTRYSLREVVSLLGTAAPLCAFSSLWLLYMLSSRWFSWLLTTPTNAGLFAFGANLLTVGVGVISLVAPAFYPRYLASLQKGALSRELFCLLGIVTVGVLAADTFCRFGLSVLFPHFSSAASSTAVILISGIPLCLCAWLIPLVIAKSLRPWREGFFMFGSSLLLLLVSMYLGGEAGLNGQAWASVLPAMALFAMHLHLTVRADLLTRSNAYALAISAGLASMSCAVVWHFMFNAV
jgi:O-antigen/teichoic acid export membrane protein